MSNYATSTVDFMHSRSPLHDGIAHAMTRENWDALSARGFKIEVRPPFSGRMFRQKSGNKNWGRLPDPDVLRARDAVLNAPEPHKPGLIVECAKACNCNVQVVRNALSRERMRRNAIKASAAGKAKYVIMPSQLAARMEGAA